MDPIEVLMDEHQEILRTLQAMDVCGARLSGGDDVPKEDVHGFVRFLREFADALHHAKEEDMLFADMMAHGMPRHAGPLAVMYAEHDESRRFVGYMADAAAGDGPLDEGARKTIAGAMRGYTALLRDHIAKEDQVLYVMARQMLPPAAMQNLGERFRLFAENDARAAPRDALLALAADLRARYAA